MKRARLVCQTQTVDTWGPREQARQLQGFWLDVARSRHQEQHPGVYAYNLCSISQGDYERLRHMHQASFHEMRRVIAASEPSERVVLLATQLIALDEQPRPR